MDKNAFWKLKKRAEELERQYGSLEEFAIQSTLGEKHHRMRMEEDYASNCPELLQVYQELSDLELAELLDEQNLGGFDGEFS